jgi:site-specific DNA-methyltransferase (adenine-specific)
MAYLKTKFARFLISQLSFSQDITKDRFNFVPIQDFSESWTDEKLYKKYGLTEEEIGFIESMIRPMDLGKNEEK